MKELQKHKKLIITLSIVLGVLVIALILNFTLFRITSVEVDFRNIPQIFTEESKESIKDDENIKMGNSIFTVSKKNLSSSLEKRYPYLKVVNVETVFPNKVIIHCAEREETYAVKANDTKYFICDADFKVLNITTTYRNEQYSAILFTGLENLIVNTNRVNAGEFLHFESEVTLLKLIGTSLLQTNKTVCEQKGLIKSIELTSGIYYFTAKNQPYFIITDYNNFKTYIYAVDTLLSQKFNYMFETLSSVIYNPSKFFEEGTDLSSISPTYYLDYSLQIRENLSSQILIRIEKNKN